MKKPWMIAVVAALLAVGGLGAFAWQQDAQTAPPASQQAPAQSDTTIQPIAFPHNIHAGTYKIDCQYCHYSAERSVDAGLPPVSACAGCHQAIPGANNPQEVAKVMDYYNKGQPIPWVRVYKVADFVHFPHMRHVKVAKIACQTCHGQVQEMGAIEKKDPAWGGDNMGWCVTCHVQRGVKKDCEVCHY